MRTLASELQQFILVSDPKQDLADLLCGCLPDLIFACNSWVERTFMEIIDQPVAMEATPSGPTRIELADAGVAQLHTLVRTTKQLLDAYTDLGTAAPSSSGTGAAQPAAAQAPAATQPPSAADAAAAAGAAPTGADPSAAATAAADAGPQSASQPMTELIARVRLLQQRYVDTSVALRVTLQQCAQLQEAQVLASQAAASTAQGERLLWRRCIPPQALRRLHCTQCCITHAWVAVAVATNKCMQQR